MSTSTPPRAPRAGARVRPARVARALAVVLVTLAGSGCAGADRLHVEGPAPTARSNGPVYVTDTLGHPLRRPAGFGLTEFSSVTELKWRSWGGDRAVATGRVGGNWCYGACPEDGYPATVVLSRLERRENIAYYTRATVRSSKRLPEVARDELRSVHLFVPED
ncbi:hypothetical protein ACFYYR_03125 [Streptomyces sp. NPDC001922]|uniref:hypothetical protein n=1 Tax=Streptomyces sp. NPDC001922 TaxID=3364624 RepID=UPI0036A93568